MDQKEIVLINKHHIPLTINFMGVFPNNKSAVPGGKFYLTDREWEWIQHNQKQIVEKKMVVLEGSEGSDEKVNTVKDQDEVKAKFFDQHVNKAKSQIAKMDNIDEINELINYANDNEINNKAVDALIERANELGE